MGSDVTLIQDVVGVAPGTAGTGTPGGSNGQIQYNNGGNFGGKATTGTGNVVQQTSPTLVTPVLGVAAGTSLALTGGAVGAQKHFLATGAAAGNIVCTGIKVGDGLNSVLAFDPAGPTFSDLTSEFTISGTNQINNTGGTATTGFQLIVNWTKLTA